MVFLWLERKWLDGLAIVSDFGNEEGHGSSQLVRVYNIQTLYVFKIFGVICNQCK